MCSESTLWPRSSNKISLLCSLVGSHDSQQMKKQRMTISELLSSQPIDHWSSCAYAAAAAPGMPLLIRIAAASQTQDLPGRAYLASGEFVVGSTKPLEFAAG